MKRLFCLTAVAVAIVAGMTAAADWPQWRGPSRDGVAATSPALVDVLNKDTPKTAWVSEAILGGDIGGYAQPAVAGDRVYVLENRRHLALETLLTDLGWAPGMPEGLVKSVESARNSQDRAKLTNTDKEIVPWADEWLKANLPKDQQKLAPAVKARLVAGAAAVPLDDLAKLDPIPDKELVTAADFADWLKKRDVTPEALEEIMGHLGEAKRVKTGWLWQRVGTRRLGADDVLWALDRATGKTVYRVEFPGQWLSYAASSAPCVADGRVYFLSSAAVAYCLDAATGKKLWEASLLKKDAKAFEHSRASSVLWLDGKVIVGSEKEVCGLDAKTGEKLWSNTSVFGEEASGVICRLGGQTAVLYASAPYWSSVKKMSCLDLQTGKELWSVPTGWSASTPVAAGDVCVFAGGLESAGPVALRMTTTGATTQWSVPFKNDKTCTAYDNYPSPIVDKGFVYIAGRGKAFCVELATGTVQWAHDVAGASLSSGILADGKVLMPAPPDLVIFRATHDQFELLGRARIGIVGYSTPAFADGFLFVRTEKNVTCYDFRKP